MNKFSSMTFLRVLAGCAIIFAGLAFFRMIPWPTPFHALQAILEEALIPDPARLFGKGSLRVLLIGLDYDYDHLDRETSKAARSDIIMAVNLDFKNHRIAELSIPRDMVATLPDGRKAKINQAQSEGGIKESKAVVANWLGIPPFDRYVVLSIDTAKDLINAIGGIDIKVENADALRNSGPNGPLDYDDMWGHLHVHLKPGFQHLAGDQAVGYARFRHDWCSDPCRILRQQQVIRAIIRKTEHDGFHTLTHTQQLIAVVRKDIETDFSPREELASVMAFSHLAQRDIHTAQVPYIEVVDLPAYGNSVVADEKKKRQLVASMFVSSGERVAVGIGAGSIRVRVENGTGVAGLAARFAQSLRRQGFTIAKITNADSKDVEVTLVKSQAIRSSASERVRRALEKNAIKAQVSIRESLADDGSDVTVVLGRDALSEVP